MNDQHEDLSKPGFELNMREVDSDYENAPKQGVKLINVVLTGLIIITLAMIGVYFYTQYQYRSVSFESADKKISIKTSTKWLKTETPQNKEKDMFSILSLNLFKKGTAIFSEQIAVSKVVSDTSDSNISEVYNMWKDNYNLNQIFGGQLKSDSKGKQISSTPQELNVAGYQALQTDFDELILDNLRVSHVVTILHVSNNFYIIDGIYFRNNKDIYLKEYNKILQTVKFN